LKKILQNIHYHKFKNMPRRILENINITSKPTSISAKKVADFKAIRIKIASPEEILANSYGEVTKAETINYRTRRPEKDGLFSEKIFGPTKDYECYCGKYKRIRYKGVICDKCGVEVTRSIVRRERMGHITLAAPVSHIWFLRTIPSRIGTILDIPLPQLEKVVYYAGYIITKVDEEAKKKVVEEIEREYQSRLKEAKSKEGASLDVIEDAYERAIEDIKKIEKMQVLSEEEYLRLSLRYGEIFEAETGSEPLRRLLSELDLKKLQRELILKLRRQGPPFNKKILRRLKMVRSLIRAKIRPEWMFLTVLPVLPPDLRPMVQLDGGRFASSDLNDLYRRVINRNNRLKRLIELKAPEVIIRNEKRMLQEAVDALLDNSMKKGKGPQTSLGAQHRPLKSLADMLRGKQGRFRQNLLGKRVDYSGRSVIVIGPELSLNQCGVPKRMALEIFKPFVIRELLKKELAHNVKGAIRLIEDAPPEVWGILEEVIKDKYVLLNRAPTLHRLSVEAFKPVLIEGLALQIPAMVCQAFNADFDGDQMAIHLPLTDEAQSEAEHLMLPGRNLLKPSSGDPIVLPTKDMVLGIYWITREEIRKETSDKNIKTFSTPEEAILAYENKVVGLRELIKVRISKGDPGLKEKLVETTVGRIIFNDILPDDFPFINKCLSKKGIREVVSQLINKYDWRTVNQVLDKMKDLGFEYATISGLSWGKDDLIVSPQKKEIIEMAQKQVEEVRQQYEEGLLTEDERRKRVIAIWRKVNDEISSLVPKVLDPEGPVYSIIDSGARGTWAQAVQMAGMKGLVINPAGEIIELPVLSSFKEGFNVLEYFISTHGARKGSTDTALRTASAGYLTRRLVDVAQDVVVREEDCKTKDFSVIKRDEISESGESFFDKILGRVAVEDIKIGKKILVKAGELIDRDRAKIIEESEVSEVKIRTVLKCKTKFGVCRKCYGYDLGYNRLVQLGDAVGIVAAQAIGEPGTQLTMRTFHTGGVATVVDITQGLPRVEEIFEARPPRGKAPIALFDGKVVDIIDQGRVRVIRIKHEGIDLKGKKVSFAILGGDNILEYTVPSSVTLWVKEGDEVKKGMQLSEGNVDLRELLKVCGVDETQRYIMREVKKIYQNAGEPINDKHLEIIIRQMFSRVRIKDPGDSEFMIGDIVDKSRFLQVNEALRASGKKPAKALQLIMGITKVALSTESFLSAASFQETSRVLVQAASEGRVDELRGLKENVIIGKLIPAGTGFRGPIFKENIED
jgi:DNA-directed RNA polymerase subunit beta'